MVDPSNTKCFKTVVPEDNNGALGLMTMEPGRMTPRSKYYGIKCHWFKSHLKPLGITVVKVDTKLQHADILLTKLLGAEMYKVNRKLTCGW